MRRLSALFLSLVLAASCFAGCSREKEPYIPTGDALSQEEATRPTGSQVTNRSLSLPYFPDRSLNPYESGDYTNQGIFSLVYQGLFTVDREYNVFPVLCETYQASWDMKTYTFRLAQASFSDGTPLTAADVVASLKAAMKSPVYRGRFRYVKSVSGEEDGVVVTLETPYENFPLLLDIPIVKQSEVSAKRPLGTGAYFYEEREEEVALRRRSDWWCKAELAVDAQRILLFTGENPAQLRDAFEFSDLSLVTADPGSESYVDFHSDYELWDSESGIFVYLGCNRHTGVMSNQSIRAALTYGVNRENLMVDCYRDFAYAAVLPASPQSPYYSNSLADDYDYAPEKLTKAVTDAGLQGAAVVLLVNAADNVRLRAARSIARSLTQCGLNVTTSELTGDNYRKALEEGSFDLYLGQTKLSANMDLSAFFEKDGALGYGGMTDPVLHALCQEALANSGNYYTLHQRLAEDGRLCPIGFRSYAVFTQRGEFSGLSPSRDHLFFYHLGRTMEDALITEEA